MQIVHGGTEINHFGIECYRKYYNKLDEETELNVILLEKVMKECGFIGAEHEWWNFCDVQNDEIISKI